jgi:hypothetical protein
MSKYNEKQSHSPKMDIFVLYSLTKWLTQGLWGCLFFLIIFILICSILLAKFYAFTQMIVTVLLVWKKYIYFISMIFFYLMIWWDIGIASESKLEILKDDNFYNHNCFYYFLLFCLIILFCYCSNIQYRGVEL